MRECRGFWLFGLVGARWREWMLRACLDLRFARAAAAPLGPPQAVISSYNANSARQPHSSYVIHITGFLMFTAKRPGLPHV